MLVITYIFMFLILLIPFLLLVSLVLKALKYCIFTFRDFKNSFSAAATKREASSEVPSEL